MSHSITIVGGGPAGASMALNLMREGIRPEEILVLDRARFPRPKLCGGALTYRGTVALRRLVGHLPGGRETDLIRLLSPRGEIRAVEPGQQWLYCRTVLDTLLLDAVKDAGVEVREQVTVKSMDFGDTSITLECEDGTSLTSRWVVGADGAAGMTRRASGLQGGGTGRLVEGVFVADGAKLDPNELYFDLQPVFDGIPGYAWAFAYPKPNHEGELLWKLGIMDQRGVTPGKVLREWTSAFAQRLGFRLHEGKIRGWPERYFNRHVKAHRPGLILIGEAWGIDPFLGEGLAPSLYMAEYSARRLAKAVRQKKREIRAFEKGFMLTKEGYNLLFQAMLAHHCYGPNGAKWVGDLFQMPAFASLAEKGVMAYGRMMPRVAPYSALSVARYASGVAR